jgi:acetoacetate decarboxylase
LTVEYRTHPDNVRRVLPPDLDLVEEDPGAVAMIWADWQSCGDDGSELLDPVRSQYKEAFVVVRCSYEGRVYSRCVFIWVDKDFALVRGYLQGYPKKLGSIHQTRPVTIGRAGPRLAPGGRFGMTLAAADRRLAEATVTLSEPSDSAGFVNGHPMVHHRWFPMIELDGRDSLSEVVTMSGVDLDLGPAWRGEATLDLFDSPTEELALLQPEEIIGGYFRTVGTTFAGGRTLNSR